MADYREGFEWMMNNEDRQRKGKVIVDAGGATKYGISLNFLRDAGVDIADIDGDGNVRERCGDIDNDGDVDADDIRLLTLEQCAKIYKPHFWDVVRGDDIASQRVANKVFDFAVNAGAKTAVMRMQRAVSDCGFSVVDDGVCGKLTLAAVNKAEPERLVRAFKEHIIAYYKHIAEVRPVSLNEFKSWMARATA